MPLDINQHTLTHKMWQHIFIQFLAENDALEEWMDMTNNYDELNFDWYEGDPQRNNDNSALASGYISGWIDNSFEYNSIEDEDNRDYWYSLERKWSRLCSNGAPVIDRLIIHSTLQESHEN